MHGHRRYIAAQGPIEESIADFFRMISDFRIVSIICTANDVEAGRVRVQESDAKIVFSIILFFSLNFAVIGQTKLKIHSNLELSK